MDGARKRGEGRQKERERRAVKDGSQYQTDASCSSDKAAVSSLTGLAARKSKFLAFMKHI